MAATTVRRKARSSDEGSLDHYLRDISAYPLITREQEAALAVRIRGGTRRRWTRWCGRTCASW